MNKQEIRNEIDFCRGKIAECNFFMGKANQLERESLQRTIGIWRDSIQKWRSALKSVATKDQGEISELDIERARKHPVVDLLPEEPVRNKIHCIVHTEKTPSMHVYKDHVYCFGCDESLDAIDIVRHLRGLDFVQAVKYINKR